MTLALPRRSAASSSSNDVERCECGSREERQPRQYPHHNTPIHNTTGMPQADNQTMPVDRQRDPACEPEDA